jgi:hypothetical protein
VATNVVSTGRDTGWRQRYRAAPGLFTMVHPALCWVTGGNPRLVRWAGDTGAFLAVLVRQGRTGLYSGGSESMTVTAPR